MIDCPEVSVYLYYYAQLPGRYGLDPEYPRLIAQEAGDQSERLTELNVTQELKRTLQHLELECET